MMDDKRKHKRVRRRLKVQYGEKDFTTVGFTTDISAGGLFIVGNIIPSLFRNVHVKVFLEQDKLAFFDGTVRRHEQVPPNLRQIAKGGFGIRFTPPEELLLDSTRSATQFDVVYATPEELQRAYLAELKHGGVFIRTERTFPRDAKVTLSISCPFLSRRIDVDAAVVHTQEGGAAERGLGVMFAEPAQVIAVLATMLAAPPPRPGSPSAGKP